MGGSMTDVTLTLREAIPTDATNLIKVMEKLNKETPFLVVNPYALMMSPDAMAHEIGYIFEEHNQLILLALDGESIVGVATVTSSEEAPLKHIGEVGISILKDYWGMGLGQLMLEDIVFWGQSSTVTRRLEIKVQQRNQRAIRLYEKIGFQEEGIIRHGVLSEDNELLDVKLMSYLV